jgi:type IV secretion system protein VirB8
MSMKSWSRFSFKKKNTAEELVGDTNYMISDVRNWYADRYEQALIQRNIALFLNALFLISMVVAVIAAHHISVTKKIDPFVVEVEEKTGVTNVVNPLSRQDITTNEALSTYFVLKYLRARETYDFYTYTYHYNSVVRLMSDQAVYAAFRNFVNNDPRSPIKIFTNTTSTTLKVRSIQFLENGTTSQVRFSIFRNSDTTTRQDRIATITFAYMQMEMNAEDRHINPLGFQVKSYRVDDEVL